MADTTSLYTALDSLEGTELVTQAQTSAEVHGGGILTHAETWVAVAFVIFVVAAFKPLKRAILGFLDKHTLQVQLALDEAQRLRQEAESILADAKEKQAQAIAEAEVMMVHAKEQAEKIKQQAALDLEKSLKRREEQAMTALAMAEEEALRDLRHRLADTVISATRHILSDPGISQDHAALFEAALSKIPKKVH